MTRLITSSLSSKAQLTLPKEIRALLGVRGKGDLVGFLVDSDTRSVRLARVDPVVAEAEFTAEESAKLMKLRAAKGSKRFKRMDALLRDLRS